MIEISASDVGKRIEFDNPWWKSGGVSDTFSGLPARAYLDAFISAVELRDVRRASVLMGPRRVGKTVMIHQTIKHLLGSGLPADHIQFVSLDTPLYTEISLQRFLDLFVERFKHLEDAPLVLFFDEVQYLKDWEVHLKSLVDSYPHYKFVVSGSAAAALRIKSIESGAGRFSDFFLPPLTFHEYISFTCGAEQLFDDPETERPGCTDIAKLNDVFLDYLSVGGYPEAVFNPQVRARPEEFIKSDIIDKVLLRDLPQLYGIRDIQELNRLFMVLAYNTGNEVSLEKLASAAGVAKPTIKRYIQYLEAAFLLRRVHRIDQNARHFKRVSTFKVYLTNPSMRCALFGMPENDDTVMGALAETALYAQWFHQTGYSENICYARWEKGEIDMVGLNSLSQKPEWAVEIKWSDRPDKDPSLLRHLATFGEQHFADREGALGITTRTISGRKIMNGQEIELDPVAWYTWLVSRNHFRSLKGMSGKK